MRSSSSSKSSNQSGRSKGGSDSSRTSRSLSSIGSYESGSSAERRYMSKIHRKNRGKKQKLSAFTNPEHRKSGKEGSKKDSEKHKPNNIFPKNYKGKFEIYK